MHTNTRNDLLSGEISNQQSLVDILEKKKSVPEVVHVLPGGKNMFTESYPIDKDKLVSILKTALKRCRYFESVRVSFLKEVADKDTQRTKLKGFPKTAKPLWEERGKAALAEEIAEAILKNKEKPTVLEITPEGVFSLVKTSKATADKPGGDNWEPKLIFVRKIVGKYNHTIL